MISWIESDESESESVPSRAGRIAFPAGHLGGPQGLEGFFRVEGPHGPVGAGAVLREKPFPGDAGLLARRRSDFAPPDFPSMLAMDTAV